MTANRWENGLSGILADEMVSTYAMYRGLALIQIRLARDWEKYVPRTSLQSKFLTIASQTLQTIALLAHLRAKGVYRLNIIVVPLSVLGNWQNEFKRYVHRIPLASPSLAHRGRQIRTNDPSTALLRVDSRARDNATRSTRYRRQRARWCTLHRGRGPAHHPHDV
jgi:hypothetical protein